MHHKICNTHGNEGQTKNHIDIYSYSKTDERSFTNKKFKTSSEE
jgi:hypothetical protein